MKGIGPAHVALNTHFNVIFVANYGSGSVVAYSIDPTTGKMADKPLYFEQFLHGSGVDPDRQEASHPHGSFFFEDNVYVTDLGADMIRHYKVCMGLNWLHGFDMHNNWNISSIHILQDKLRSGRFCLR